MKRFLEVGLAAAACLLVAACSQNIDPVRNGERIEDSVPETREVHRRYGIRGYDWTAVRQASRRDRWLWRAFRVALAACKTRYALERSYYRHLARERKCPAWEPIIESKRPISSD